MNGFEKCPKLLDRVIANTALISLLCSLHSLYIIHAAVPIMCKTLCIKHKNGGARMHAADEQPAIFSYVVYAIDCAYEHESRCAVRTNAERVADEQPNSCKQSTPQETGIYSRCDWRRVRLLRHKTYKTLQSFLC